MEEKLKGLQIPGKPYIAFLSSIAEIFMALE